MKVKIKYKSVLSRIKNIEKRNIAFDALSDEDKRKEVAWDALQLILNDNIKGSLITDKFRYWSSNLTDIDGVDSKDFQLKLVKKLPERCNVCARGAVMLSCIRLGNSIDAGSYSRTNGLDSMDKSIAKGFSTESLLLMERVYENSPIGDYEHLPYVKGSDLTCNSIKVREQRTKLLANILCNVIVNGYFNIDDCGNYLILD